MNLWVIFLTGLTVGGLTCLAVQGGLLASVIAAAEGKEIKEGVNKKNAFTPTLAFLVAKLIAYTLLGFLLGAFGEAIGINQTTQNIMQLVAGTYMVLIALNLLNVHPIFRYVVIQPPRFLAKKVKSQSKSKDIFAPALLGAMTIFIPCGTTLAMEALAISSANPIYGAMIMAVFVLGTTPLFFGVGFVTSILGDKFRTRFLKFAAVGVLYLGLTSLNGALVASGSPLTIQTIGQKLNFSSGEETNKIPANFSSDMQIIDLNITASGYYPTHFKVSKNIPLRINLISKDAYSCASAFRIPSLGIAKNLSPSGSDFVVFTPEKEGIITFTCSMGMYSGIIEVI